MRLYQNYLFRFFLFIWVLFGTAYPSKSISYTPIYNNLHIDNSNIKSSPIEPISKKQQRKKVLRKPIWDIIWLYGIAGGAIFLPISLLFFGLGLGANLIWLGAIGLVFGLILMIGLLLFYFSLRNNESTADHFMERWAIILTLSVLALFGLVAFIVALILPLLWLWITGLIIFLAAGITALLLAL